jgi:hypothetical protein
MKYGVRRLSSSKRLALDIAEVNTKRQRAIKSIEDTFR